MALALPMYPAGHARLGDAVPPPSLLDALLREQQSTAVEKFSQWHDRDVPHLQERHYRDLIPISRPSTGEQYAFEVDLDACSGCKACVVACHNLNGLEETETWRSVGLLHGGTSDLPMLQHVTTACHHCVEPACLDGCPVLAYEKDPLTGIVRHLDDQCIGCQYCVLKCPYDVPKYSYTKGIVRKCDMCSDRLAVGEAPACVQACPNRAIRINVVSKQTAVENAEANLFLPGAPEPRYTLPTTVYKTKRALPTNLLPADYYAAAPQHAHWPLVLMLVLTQMSVGAFIVEIVLMGLNADAGLNTAPGERGLHLATAFGLGVLGLGAATLHLGRPWLAYRAAIGWRTSWLSREVLAFGVFAKAAAVYAAAPWLSDLGIELSPAWNRVLGGAVAVSGLFGVVCSIMIYASTRRTFWNPAYTGLKFLLTGLVLGLPVALLIRLVARVASDNSYLDLDWQNACFELSFCILCVALVKLIAEAAIFGWLRSRIFTPLRRTALLMTGALGRVTFWRFATGLAGGLALPAFLCASCFAPAASLLRPAPLLGIVTLLLVLNFVGEILERYLFFAAVVAPKMPGVPCT
jgi:Fe-S-cluster-containing dehydrogenase component/DMSO reductase anchor subunit